MTTRVHQHLRAPKDPSGNPRHLLMEPPRLMTDELIIQDFSDVIPNSSINAPGRWAAMFLPLDAGRKIAVSEGTFDYFMNVLPPRWFGGHGCFLFGEGQPDVFYFFSSSHGKFYAEGWTRAKVVEQIGAHAL